jgi:glycosyltransferase involved in cell wall biosynthesis
MDEAVNIAACLRSCVSCDDVHVVDSGSDDATRDIASAMGATVHRHPFESFGRQRNWAIDRITLRHDWVLHLDADERLTPALDAELRSIAASGPSEAGYYVPSRLMFMGRWMRRTAGPMHQVRFFHRERLRFVDHGHGQREQTNGALGRVASPYLHESFSKGLDSWFEKHNRYSSGEAEQVVAAMTDRIPWRALLSRDSVRRRRALKATAYRLPFRAQLRWFYMAVVRLGFLDGREGLAYISLVVSYERMTTSKIKWLRASRDPKADATTAIH